MLHLNEIYKLLVKGREEDNDNDRELITKDQMMLVACQVKLV